MSGSKSLDRLDPSRAADAEAAREGRRRARETEGAVFEAIRRGAAHADVARAHDLSVAAVRRIVARELRRRAPERDEAYRRTQIARLERTILAINATIEEGDWRAAFALPRLLTALDRYHGVSVEDLRNLRFALPPPDDALATIDATAGENDL